LAPQPIKEEFLLTGLLEPTNEPYALAKIAGLKMAEYYRKEYGCDFISAIPNNLYGINDHFHPQNSHVLPALLRKMHLAKCMQNNDISAIRRDLARDYPITSNEDMEAILAEFGIERRENEVVLKLWGSGSPFREFMFADDLADALIFLMAHYSASAPVNIGTGHDISIYDLAMLVRQTVDFAGEILWDSSKPDGTPRKQLDITKLSELGFRATTPLSEGLSKTYEWYKETL
jgi:GDP-L-fucose synthase